MCCTYIIYSNNIDKFYIGYSCSDINARLEKHNQNHKGFTGKANDWKLVYTEYFDSKSEAMLREKQIKSWNNVT